MINKVGFLVIGNATIDEVYTINGWPHEGTSNKFMSYRRSLGGIGNILRSLKPFASNRIVIGADLPVGSGNIRDTDFIISSISRYAEYVSLCLKTEKPHSKALIISNIKDNERTSFVDWGCGVESWKTSDTEAQWGHISYLDVLAPIADQSRVRCDILSADLCLSNPSLDQIHKVLDQSKYLDYLFLSESEMHVYGKQSLSMFLDAGAKAVVLHDKSKTYFIDKDGMILIEGKHSIIENIDVLGAGDAYCGRFALHIIENPKDIRGAIELAHIAATDFISRSE